MRRELVPRERAGPISHRLACVDLSSMTLPQLARLITSEACRLLNASRAALWVYRPALHNLVLPEEEDHAVIPLSEEQELPREPAWGPPRHDALLRQLVTESFGAASGGNLAQVLVLPLVASGRQQGLLLLEVAGSDPRGMARDAALLVSQAAAMLANLETLSVARRHERELQALYDTAGELSSNLDLETVLQAIVDRARALIGSDVSYITLFDEDSQTIYMRVTSGIRRSSFKDIRLKLGEGLGGLVAEEWRALYTSDYLNDTRFRHRPDVDHEVRGEGIKSILGVPMRLADKTIGVLYVANRRLTSYTDADVDLLSSLAHHAAIAIDNARLFEQVREAAVRVNEAHQTIERQLRRLQRTEEVHRQLTELVLGGEGLDAITSVLAQLIHKPVTIIDANLRLLAAAGDPVDAFDRVLRQNGRVPVITLAAEPLGRALRRGATLRAVRVEAGRQSHPRLLVPVVAKGSVLAYLLVLLADEHATDEMEVLLEQGARVVALEILKEQTVAEVEERSRREFLDDLLAERPPSPQMLKKRGKQVGVDLSRNHRVSVFQIDYSTPEQPSASLLGRRSRQLLSALLRETIPMSFVAERSSRIIVLLQEPPSVRGTWLGLVRRLKDRVETGEPGVLVTAVVGGVCLAPSDYRREIQLAEKALQLITEIGRTGTVVELSSLGVLPLLFDDKNRSEIQEFVDRVLGPLLRYDAEHGTALLDTLEAHFLSLGSVARTAERCHVHVNTVYYRLDRIREVLGRDFADPEIALDLQVALRARRLLAQGEPRAL